MWNRIGKMLWDFICAGAVGAMFYFAARTGDPEQIGLAAFLSTFVLIDFMRSERSNGQAT